MIRFLLIFLTAFRVAFVGDPQVDSPKELEYAQKSVYKQLRQRQDLDLVVILGDLVNEKPELTAPSEASLDSLSCPWVRVSGNHDGIGALRDTVIAAGRLHIILLDNVRRTRKGYEGGLLEVQKQWLDSAVRSIPLCDRIVICSHIPFSQSKGKDTLSNILSAHRNILLVCGHTHQVARHIVERGVEEVVAGASCGSWWRGVRDTAGIPYALMNCGAPRGWFLADFKTGPCSGPWYRLSYEASGRKDVVSASIREGRLVVNVYGGSCEGDVFVKTKGGRWKPLSHYYAIAPEVEDVISANASLSREYRKSHKEEFIPLRRLPSTHLWSCPAENIIPGSTIKLRYRDNAMRFCYRVIVSPSTRSLKFKSAP